MFKEMRKKDRSIDIDESINILKSGQYGVLSTVGENGYAYGVPLNYTYFNGGIYFHCAREGSKLDNILHNDKVSFCVVGSTEPMPEKFSYRYESTIVFGSAAEVFDEEKESALVELIKKYSADFLEKGIEYVKKDASKTKVIKISIEHISGKARK